MAIDKIILVTRPTRLQESVKRYNTKQQARFFVQSRGQSFDDYESEDANYLRARDQLVKSFPAELRFQVIDRSFLPNFVFGPDDLVITLGQDGLVVNTAKYLDGQAVLAVNPDPSRFDGVLLPFLPDQVAPALQRLLRAGLQQRSISMARVDLNDGQSLFAFNDLFLGVRTHTSARYTIHHRKKSERHSSSGLIVSTPAGSTGWLSSMYNMAAGVAQFAGAASKKIAATPLAWEERKLLFVVREPFRSKWSGADLVCGEIRDREELTIESHMSEGGVIFSDGMESDFLEFNAGATAKVRLAEKTTRLLLNPED
ncbi:MAG: NAD+ kinase [Leptospirales bacterium]|nr:NAD+ kinase [Leptospirales bacterium]